MRIPRKLLLLTVASLFLLSTPFSTLSALEDFRQTDLSGLSQNQEIDISIDTSLPQAIHQPIDVRIKFDQSCWAKNETQHSIRVAYYDGNDYTEIESQIYDLSHSDETHIDSCSIVFLIPEEATGKETYHVFYSDKEAPAAEYPDHIIVKDNHYFYEPITGQIMDFDYYQITEDGDAIYGICQKGELLGNGMSNAVVKLLPGSKEFSSKNAEQIAGFYTSYSINPPGEHTGTQWASDITKTILVDGNLMTRIRIKGTSPNDELQTDNIYTYYHNPTDTKRLSVNVNHQTLKDIQVEGTQQREGTFASLSTIKARSGTIEDMNLGEILPKVHFYNEDETIVDYDMPTDPDAHPAEWLLGYSDDQDLGSKAWLCIDDPATGRAHGLIFEGNTGYLEGEFDGIQVKTSVHQHVKLPGLEADSGDIFAFRNAYENGEHLTTLSQGENILFNVEYIALQQGGYERVDQESEIFQSLIKETPISRGNQTVEEEPEEEPERYTIKATVRQGFSAPLGSLLSAGLGKNISYLNAELHKATTLVSSGSVGRLKFNSLDIEFAEDATLVDKVQQIRSMFDFKNSTFFKTITFNDVEAGTYLIKIYKENPRRHDERQFIGFSIVDVTEDTSTRINCKTQTTVELSISDQDETPIETAEAYLLLDDVLISKTTANTEGNLVLPLPTYTNQEFTLQTIYDGFLLSEEQIKLNFLNRFRPWTTTVSINRYDLKLTVKDNLGLTPGIDPRPLMKSKEMVEETSLPPEMGSEGVYQFTDLYQATYDLTLSYKSWEYTETVNLDNDKTLEIVFPAEFTLETTTLNKIGESIDTTAVRLVLEREGEKIKTSINEKGMGRITAPPGTYYLSIYQDDALIAAQHVNIKGEKTMDLVSNQSSAIHEMLPILLIVLAGFSVGLFYWKKHSTKGIYLFIALVLLSSIVLPWWQLHGETSDAETTSETYLFPSTLITRTSSDTIIGGEISEVPELFTTVLSLLTMLILISSVLIILNMFLKNKMPKISLILSVFIIIILLLTVILFWVTMTEVTKIGIGDFSGSGDIELSLPGESEQLSIPSNWGAGLGLYVVILSLIGFIAYRFFPIIKEKIIKKK